MVLLFSLGERDVSVSDFLELPKRVFFLGGGMVRKEKIKERKEKEKEKKRKKKKEKREKKNTFVWVFVSGLYVKNPKVVEGKFP